MLEQILSSLNYSMTTKFSTSGSMIADKLALLAKSSLESCLFSVMIDSISKISKFLIDVIV